MCQRSTLPSSSEWSSRRNIANHTHSNTLHPCRQQHQYENLRSQIIGVYVFFYLFCRNKSIWSMVDTATPMPGIRLQQLLPHSMQAIMLRVIPRMRYRDRPVPAAPEQAPQRRAIHWVLESNTMQCCQVTAPECSTRSTRTLQHEQ